MSLVNVIWQKCACSECGILLARLSCRLGIGIGMLGCRASGCSSLGHVKSHWHWLPPAYRHCSSAIAEPRKHSLPVAASLRLRLNSQLELDALKHLQPAALGLINLTLGHHRQFVFTPAKPQPSPWHLEVGCDRRAGRTLRSPLQSLLQPPLFPVCQIKTNEPRVHQVAKSQQHNSHRS